ncbi:MAG: fibronectin type protein [Candidatus Kaiserbacteria bacterium]|nr:fibronectin type protein [Candidatus Kaiserbacteria bacterium]
MFITLFFFSACFSVVQASTYSGLPNDVYIKQQEEKSALEYRLQILESKISANPDASTYVLQDRITQLEDERNTKINYIKGRYGQLGITSQADAAIADINAKYDVQINSLKSQIKSMQVSSSAQDSLNSEINDIKQRLEVIENQKSLPENTRAVDTPVIASTSNTVATPRIPVIVPVTKTVAVAKVIISRTLSKNMKGDDVKNLQTMLAGMTGIYPEGSVTGVFGPATERAVKRFQKNNGLEATGATGPKTRALLNDLTINPI